MQLVAIDPEGKQLLDEMRAMAGSLVSLRLPRLVRGPAPTGTKDVRTRTARYRLRGTYIAASLGLGDAVLVAAERLTPELPTPERLTECYGLTSRESEVALFLAQGLSNHQIGQRLKLSRHTVRHHAEWVFEKLGIHSRKALGLTLLNAYSAYERDQMEL